MKIRKVKNSEMREEPMIVLQDMVPNPWNAPSKGKSTHRRKENPPLHALVKEKR